MPVRDDLHHNKDLVIAVVGVVVLAVLTVGLFALGQVQFGTGAGGSDQLGVFEITFTEEDHGIDLGDRAEGTLSDGEENTTSVPIEALNVTRSEFVLTWGQDGPGDVNQDTFSIAVEHPSETFTCDSKTTGTSGSLTIECAGVEIPETIEEIAGRGEEGALRNAAQEQAPPDDGATGTYNVTITLEDTGPEPTDDGNGYQLEATYWDFHAHAERIRSA